MRSNEVYQGQPKMVKGKELGLEGEQGEKDWQFIPIPVPFRPASSEWYNPSLHRSLPMTEEEVEFWCTFAMSRRKPSAGEKK